MEKNVIFIFERKTITIQCKKEDDMNKIYQKFATKIKINDINDFDYFYEDKKITNNLTFEKLANDSSKNEIIISVEKKLKIVKCPKCICNDSIININNYKISFSNCKYGHNDNKIFEEYDKSQKIDYSQIICGNNKCGKSQKELFSQDFYKCLKCTQLTGRTKYFCNECKKNHDTNHKTIKYDEKNYYCENHFMKYLKYCSTCHQNLCKLCENEHKKHKEGEKESIRHNIKSYEQMEPNLNNIKESLSKISGNINDLRHIIEDIKESLDGAIKLFEKYNEIANDIINKYELYNKEFKNYRIIKSVKNLIKSNETVLNDLEVINKEKDIRNKINILIDIFNGDRKNYRVGIVNTICDENDDNEEEKSDIMSENAESKLMKNNENNYEKDPDISNKNKSNKLKRKKTNKNSS